MLRVDHAIKLLLKDFHDLEQVRGHASGTGS